MKRLFFLLTITALLTRMSALVLLITLVAGFIGLGLIKQISWVQTAKYLLLFLLIVFAGTSWFYLGQNRQDVFGVGEGGEPDIIFYKRQPIAFYTQVPFKLMMNYPIRFARHTPPLTV